MAEGAPGVMTTTLTAAQLQQLQATAKLLFLEGTELAKGIPDALERAATGCSEAIQVLHSRRATTTEVELRGLLDGAILNHAELFESCKRVAVSVGALPAALAAAGDEGAAEARRERAAETADPRVALGEARAAAAFDPMRKHLAVGMAAFALSDVIDHYTQTTESFLGHAAGSAKVGERLTRVAEAFAKDAAGLVLPPFIGTAYEVFRQGTDSQMQRDIAALASETGDRLFSLRRIQAELRARVDHAQEIVDISTKSGVSAAFDERRAMTIAEIVLRDHEGSLNRRSALLL